MKKNQYLSAKKILAEPFAFIAASKKLKVPAMLLVFIAPLLFSSAVFALADIEITTMYVPSGVSPVMDDKPRSGNCNTVRVGIRNIGDAPMPAVSGDIVFLLTPEGSTSPDRHFFNIPSLEPKESATIDVNQVVFPANFSTMRARVNASREVPENTFNNNHKYRNFTVSQPCFVRRAPTSAATIKCDLELRFIAPVGQTINRNSRTRFAVIAKNIGVRGQCQARKIRLMRYSNGTGSGLGSQVGGSGASRVINALGPNQSQQVDWIDQLNTAGSYSYRASFTSPYNDANNNNHRPLKRINVR